MRDINEIQAVVQMEEITYEVPIRHAVPINVPVIKSEQKIVYVPRYEVEEQLRCVPEPLVKRSVIPRTYDDVVLTKQIDPTFLHREVQHRVKFPLEVNSAVEIQDGVEVVERSVPNVIHVRREVEHQIPVGVTVNNYQVTRKQLEVPVPLISEQFIENPVPRFTPIYCPKIVAKDIPYTGYEVQKVTKLLERCVEEEVDYEIIQPRIVPRTVEQIVSHQVPVEKIKIVEKPIEVEIPIEKIVHVPVPVPVRKDSFVYVKAPYETGSFLSTPIGPVPFGGAPQFSVPQFGAPNSQFGVPQFGAPNSQFGVPQFSAPQFPNSQFGVPQFSAPQFSVPQFGVRNSQFSVPQFGAPNSQFGVPQFSSPQFPNSQFGGYRGAPFHLRI